MGASSLSRLTTREVFDRCMTMASALLPGSAQVALALTDLAAHGQSGRGLAARMATAMLLPAHRHFCVDEDPDKASHVMHRLQELGMGGIIDYAAEAATNEAMAWKNTRGVMRTAAARIPNRSAIVCKMSALAPPKLLEQHSAYLWANRHVELGGDPMLLAGSSVPPNAAPLRDVLGSIVSEAEMMDSISRVERRLHRICEAAVANNLQVMLDAEEWAIQPAIDRLAFRAMEKFNVGKPVVHQTIQSYLADSSARLDRFSAAGLKRGVKPGIKVVRGAYMELEDARSRSQGTPSPVCTSIEHTADQYRACVDHVINRLVPGGGSLLVCTHNKDAARSIIADHGLVPTTGTNDDWPPRVRFAQLKGMADSLSLELAEAGFTVDKYVPYGEISTTLKYLARRSLENSSASSAAYNEFIELSQELIRRAVTRPGPSRAVPEAY